MVFNMRSIVAAALAMAVMLSAASLQAQSRNDSSPDWRPGMMDWDDMPMMRGSRGVMMGPGMGWGGGLPFEHVEGRLAFLKTELGITEAQMPQWNAFADAFRANAKVMQDMHDRMFQSARPDTWLDRLNLHESFMAAHLDGLRKMKAVAEPLYNSMSDQQKKTADKLMFGMGMM